MNIGYFFLFGAVVTSGLNTLLLQQGIQKGDTNRARFLRSLFQTVLIVGVIVLTFGPKGVMLPHHVGVFFSILNGLLGAIAFILFCEGLESTEVSTAKPALTLRMIPVVLMGVFLLGEQFTLREGIGTVMVIFAVILLSTREK